jgi:hypothetical protein
VPIVLKSGNLNLLEPYGPVQTCYGIALPFAGQNTVAATGTVLNRMNDLKIIQKLKYGNKFIFWLFLLMGRKLTPRYQLQLRIL